MRFRSELRWGLAGLLLVGAVAMVPAHAQAPSAPVAPAAAASGAAPVTADAVERVVQQLRDEEHFGRKEPERYLRFKKDTDKDKKPGTTTDHSKSWWSHFIEWLNQAGRVGVWTLGALAVALVVVLGLRTWRQADAGGAAIAPTAAAPRRVRQYDIRPESLPADVGGTAWAQWQAGDRHAALVLLYRGALSRLVHRHSVPIRASSTEGDCMGLAARHAPGARSDFFAAVARARLVGSYAGRWPADAEVQALCEAFEAQLAAVAETAGANP
ncbi:MAG: DUF4129 domain-containing protein [Pseudomonadota bacterium]